MTYDEAMELDKIVKNVYAPYLAKLAKVNAILDQWYGDPHKSMNDDPELVIDEINAVVHPWAVPR
jgi:hypothetical protein